MISPPYCQLQARYNRWMNDRLYALAGELDDVERKRDRGAFFGSIHRTLNHILWGDRIWLGRFSANPYPVAPYGADVFDKFETLVRERELTDTAILAWSGEVTEAWLASTLDYRAASDGRRRQLPAWIATVHLYQHATHHRGQLTTLLKQAGKDPGIADLPYLPGVVRVVD
jgi:uncharacterized damage-inducible protein DinB